MKLSTLPSSQPNANSGVEVDMTDETPLAQVKNLRLYRYAGYGLLLLALADFLYLLLPLQLLNSVWEYKFVSDLVRLVPVPLLAFILIFQGQMRDRSLAEKQVLRLLSWLTLGISIFFLLLIPLTIVNTLRIDRFNNEQISVQLNQKTTQLDATQAQLAQANPERLQQLMSILDEQSPAAEVLPSSAIAKAEVLERLKLARENNKTQANQARSNLRQNLLKNSLKLVVQSFITAVMFIVIWQMTAWARGSKPSRYRPARMTPLKGLIARFSSLKSGLRSCRRKRLLTVSRPDKNRYQTLIRTCQRLMRRRFG